MKKLERTDWFENGLNVLEREGFQRITIENLCSLLNITKGSFYHHFKNIDGYIESLMKYWQEKNTIDFIEKAEKQPTGNDKLTLLNNLAASASHRCEQVIRAWSFSNEIVRAGIKQVDEIRLQYLINLNLEKGLDKQTASDFALLEYATLIGIQQLAPDISKDDFKRLYHLFYKN